MKLNAIRSMLIASLIIILLYVLGLFLPIIKNSKNSKIEDFDKIEGPYDRIFTVAESLLPIQAKLEKEWGLNNLSENKINSGFYEFKNESIF